MLPSDLKNKEKQKDLPDKPIRKMLVCLVLLKIAENVQNVIQQIKKSRLVQK